MRTQKKIDRRAVDAGRIPTGIQGLDELASGGLPRGRTTLIVGGPGCGKTVCALQMLATAARDFGEPGIFVAFEERARNVVAHARAFGWDLDRLQKKKLFFLEAQLSPAVVQSGPFDLSGLLAGLGAKAKEMGARRIVFDGLDALLSMLDDPAAERREAYRLRDWLDRSGLTGIITAKPDSPDATATPRDGHLQYLADCVILLQHRLSDQTAVRGIRILKYRGTAHCANETPFLISSQGIEVGAVERAEMSARVWTTRVSTGVPRLDAMMSGGYHRGSAVLISGAPGTAKSTLAAAFAAASSARGERTLYVSFDEPAEQIVRNMRSVGIDIERGRRAGTLRVMSVQARSASSEEHVLRIRRLLREGGYRSLIIDPVSALASAGGPKLSTDAVMRLLHQCKEDGITTLVTAVIDAAGGLSESTATSISTIADTWMQTSYVIRAGERNRALTIIKSRGTGHSNQVRELVLSKRGVTLTDVYTAGGEVLMGTLRWEKEQEARSEREHALREAAVRQRELEATVLRRRADIERIRAEMEARLSELERLRRDAEQSTTRHRGTDATLRRLRKADQEKKAGRRG